MGKELEPTEKYAVCLHKDHSLLIYGAHVYQLSEPVHYVPSAREGTKEETTNYIVVSGVDVPGYGPETLIFPADKDGKVTSYAELAGSFRGSIDHELALENLGYTTIIYNQEFE